MPRSVGPKPLSEVPNQSSRCPNTRINKTNQAAVDGTTKADGYQCSLIVSDAIELPRTWRVSPFNCAKHAQDPQKTCPVNILLCKVGLYEPHSSLGFTAS